MTAERGFRFLPGVAQDITEIWEFIAEGRPPAKLLLKIWKLIKSQCPE